MGCAGVRKVIYKLLKEPVIFSLPEFFRTPKTFGQVILS